MTRLIVNTIVNENIAKCIVLTIVSLQFTTNKCCDNPYHLGTSVSAPSTCISGLIILHSRARIVLSLTNTQSHAMMGGKSLKIVYESELFRNRH